MSSKDNSIFKIRKENNYVAIDNKIFSNNSLSWKAKGILGYLLSKPSDWEVRIKDLMNQSTDGRDSVMTGLKELEGKNYLYKEKRRNDRGHFKGWTYLVFENPTMNDVSSKSENPKSGNPISDSPTSENPTYTNKDSTKTDRTNKRLNKKRTTTIDTEISNTPEVEKVKRAWDETFDVVVDWSDKELIKHVKKAVQKYGFIDLKKAIHYRSKASYYKVAKPDLRDHPKCFFPFHETIEKDMGRRPFKIITYDKMIELQQQGTTKRFEMDPEQKDSQGRAKWRMFDE